MNVANRVLLRMANILKANKVNVFVSSVLFVFWYHSPNINLGTRSGRGVSVTPRPLSTPGKEPVPIVQEAEWAPGPVWIGAENLAPTGIGFPGPSNP
jgi:hypothetical protein